jgi:hypothetical protein
MSCDLESVCAVVRYFMVAQNIMWDGNNRGMGGCSAYSPESLVPKLLPTSPVQVQYSPAAFVQVDQAIRVLDMTSTRRIFKENILYKVLIGVPKVCRIWRERMH